MIFSFSRQAGGDNPIFNWIFDLFGNFFPDTQPVQTSFNRHKLLSLLEAKVLDIFGRRKKRRSIGTSCFFLEYPKKRGDVSGFERWGCFDFFTKRAFTKVVLHASELLITSHNYLHRCLTTEFSAFSSPRRLFSYFLVFRYHTRGFWCFVIVTKKRRLQSHDKSHNGSRVHEFIKEKDIDI